MSYPAFTPDIFDEHADDARDLDIEIMGGIDDDDSPRMLGAQDTYAETLGNAEMIGLEQEAILSTLKRARDNRRPCPPMKAVDLDAPLDEERDVLGEAVRTASPEVFPVLTTLVESYRAAGKPRIVRLDTEESYEAFRTAQSPERMALLQRVAEIEAKLAAHIKDPHAHGRVPQGAQEDLAEAAEMHDAVTDIEQGKRIPLRMPRHFDGLMDAWHQDGMALSSVYLPRQDGGRWVATASESLQKGQLEAAKAATEAGIPAAAIVGYLPAIGASLAQADATKSLASGAEATLKRPEAQRAVPFMVRLEPQVSPVVFALGELCWMCCAGHAKACEEWDRLAAAAPVPLRQAMAEILAVMKPRPVSPQTTVGGAVGDFFTGLWHKIRGLFAPAAAPAPALTALPAAAPPRALLPPMAKARA